MNLPFIGPARCALARILAGLAWISLCVPVMAADAAPCSRNESVYIGTDGTGLRALRFDACTGQMSNLAVVADVAKPRWVTPHPQKPIVYVALDAGQVQAYARDRTTGALALRNATSAGGAGTTFLAIDAASMTLLATNFGAGSASSMGIEPDGSLGPLVSTLKSMGSGPHPRQASPHAHGASVDPSGRYALVADMGADRVFVYGFDGATHALVWDDGAAPRSLVLPPGSGPRRALFAPNTASNSRFVYVLNELSADILVALWEPAQGRLIPQQTVPLSSAEFKGAKSASELALSRDGRFLYAANRGEGTLQVYSVDSTSGNLTLLQSVPSGGVAPWAFDMHPSGKWLLVANYRSNRLNLFSVDAASGRLADTGQVVESPAPVSAVFAN